MRARAWSHGSSSSTRADADRPHHDGAYGWGESFCAPGLAETIRELAPLLEGCDPRPVEPLVQRLHLATAHVSTRGTVYQAISGIEAALRSSTT